MAITLLGQWLGPGWTAAADQVIPAGAAGANGTLSNAGTVLSLADPAVVPGDAFAYMLRMGASDTNDLITVALALNATNACTVFARVYGAAAPPSGSISRLWHVNTEAIGMIWGHTSPTYRNAGFRAPPAASYPAARFPGVFAGLTHYDLAIVWDMAQLIPYTGAVAGTPTASVGAGTNTTNGYIGNINTANQGFNGWICDVRVYQGAATVDELATIGDEKNLPLSGVRLSPRSMRIGIGMGI